MKHLIWIEEASIANGERPYDDAVEAAVADLIGANEEQWYEFLERREAEQQAKRECHV